MTIKMKKTASFILASAMAMGMVSCGSASSGAPAADKSDDGMIGNDISVMRFAMVTDFGDVTDQSFNQTCYEACKKFAGSHGADFTYYKPNSDSDADRMAMIDKAVADGYDIMILPGYVFASNVVEAADAYPDVKFITLDLSEADILAAAGTDSFSRENVFSAVYQSEVSGYLAGYAAVKLGYRHLGFLGGMAAQQIILFGSGFVQGADHAAEETGEDIVIDYAYCNQFYGDADITAAMETWYSGGTEVVFSCGGGIYTSVGEAAQSIGGKVIGVDVDQAPVIDRAYGDGITVTSALKGLAPTIDTVLTSIEEGKWNEYGGTIQNLGLVSADDVSLNYVGLSESTQWNDKFTQDDYKILVKSVIDGDIKISDDYSSEKPSVSDRVTLNFQGNLK